MSRKHWLLSALVLSLVLNGIVLGSFLGHRFFGREHVEIGKLTREMLRDEPDEFARPVREAMREKRRDFRQAFRELRSSRRDMFSLLQQENLDRAALLNGFERIRLAEQALKQLSHEVLAEVLPAMPVEQRLRFALPEPRDRRGDGIRRPGPPPELPPPPPESGMP